MISRDANPPESLTGRSITDGKSIYTVDGTVSGSSSPGGGLFRVTHVSGPHPCPANPDAPLYANFEWFYSAEDLDFADGRGSVG